jgi:hypothetical protein
MKFISKLKEKKYATSNQKKEEIWDVEGILHNQIEDLISKLDWNIILPKK